MSYVYFEIVLPSSSETVAREISIMSLNICKRVLLRFQRVNPILPLRIFSINQKFKNLLIIVETVRGVLQDSDIYLATVYAQMGESVQAIYSIQSVCKRIAFVGFFVNIKQTTNFRLHDEQTVNGLMKITWASIFRLMSPCLYVSMSPCLHASMSMSSCLCLHVYVTMSPMSSFSMSDLHVSRIPQTEKQSPRWSTFKIKKACPAPHL